MNTQIKAIVFDIGGVLLDWDPRYLYRKLIQDEEKIETFLHTVCTYSWNLEQDRGRSWAEAVADLSAKFPEHSALIQAYDERWVEMIDGAILGSVDIMMELRRRGYPLYAITNFSSEKLKIAMQAYPFLRGFNGMIVSGDVKLLKPDPAIYKALLDTYHLNPRELLFIDDRRENVQAAWECGFHAIHFLSPAQLEQDLIETGILIFDNDADDDGVADDVDNSGGCGAHCGCHHGRG